MDLNHANALVTGGSDGYGRGIAKVLRDAGANVWITGRDAAKPQRNSASAPFRRMSLPAPTGTVS